MFSGWITQKLVDHPEELFDDKEHFHGVEFPHETKEHLKDIPLNDLETNRKLAEGPNSIKMGES